MIERGFVMHITFAINKYQIPSFLCMFSLNGAGVRIHDIYLMRTCMM